MKKQNKTESNELENKAVEINFKFFQGKKRQGDRLANKVGEQGQTHKIRNSTWGTKTHRGN